MPKQSKEKLKCKICGKEYLSRSNFVTHLKKIHDLSKEDYYCTYIDANAERQCKICGKDLPFIDFKQGFRSRCTHTTLNCKICGKEYTHCNGLSKHVECAHNLTTREYYDKYLKNDDDGLCKICGKPTRFKSIVLGYLKTCCADCTREFNTGYRNNFQNPKSKQKIKETCLTRYGTEYFFQSETFKEKAKKKHLQRYGFEHHMKSKIMKDKVARSCEKIYGEGIYTPRKAKECINKIKKKKQENLDIFCRENNCTPLNALNLFYASRSNKELNIDFLRFNDQKLIRNEYLERYKELDEKFQKEAESYNSKYEVEIHEWLKNMYFGKIQFNTRKVITPLELDFYIPKKKLAIEFNGDYWHSTNSGKDPNYHLNKTQLCQEKGIQLMHIFEYEWLLKKDICKSIISSALGIYENKIYARECEVKEVSSKEAKVFLEENHLQGFIASNYRIGLYYNDELVQLLCFGKNRFKNNEIELLRMCTKLNTQVIGGFSKLLKYQPYNDFVSYIDLSKFTASSYLKNGFSILNQSAPNYKYIKGERVLNRIQAQKHKLPKLLGDKFDESKTESQNMLDNGWWKVYDCGNLKLEFTKQ